MVGKKCKLHVNQKKKFYRCIQQFKNYAGLRIAFSFIFHFPLTFHLFRTVVFSFLLSLPSFFWTFSSKPPIYFSYWFLQPICLFSSPHASRNSDKHQQRVRGIPVSDTCWTPTCSSQQHVRASKSITDFNFTRWHLHEFSLV